MKQFVKLAAATAVLAALSAPAFANEVKVGDTYFKLRTYEPNAGASRISLFQSMD